MADYIVDRYSIPTSSIVVKEEEIDVSSLSIALVGQLRLLYGGYLNENFVHLLENFAGPTPPENPITGQIWFDISEKIFRVFDETDGKWKRLGIPILSGLPLSAKEGDVVIVDKVIYRYTSGNWEIIFGFHIGNTPPSSPGDYYLWFDTQTNSLKVYYGGTWMLVQNTSITTSYFTEVGKDYEGPSTVLPDHTEFSISARSLDFNVIYPSSNSLYLTPVGSFGKHRFLVPPSLSDVTVGSTDVYGLSSTTAFDVEKVDEYRVVEVYQIDNVVYPHGDVEFPEKRMGKGNYVYTRRIEFSAPVSSNVSLAIYDVNVIKDAKTRNMSTAYLETEDLKIGRWQNSRGSLQVETSSSFGVLRRWSILFVEDTAPLLVAGLSTAGTHRVTENSTNYSITNVTYPVEHFTISNFGTTEIVVSGRSGSFIRISPVSSSEVQRTEIYNTPSRTLAMTTSSTILTDISAISPPPPPSYTRPACVFISSLPFWYDTNVHVIDSNLQLDTGEYLVIGLHIDSGYDPNDDGTEQILYNGFDLSSIGVFDNPPVGDYRGKWIKTSFKIFEVTSGGTGILSYVQPTRIYGSIFAVWKVSGSFDRILWGHVEDIQTNINIVNWNTPTSNDTIGIGIITDYDTVYPNMFFNGLIPTYNDNVGSMVNGRGTCFSVSAGQYYIDMGSTGKSSQYTSNISVIVFDTSVSAGSGGGGGGSSIVPLQCSLVGQASEWGGSTAPSNIPLASNISLNNGDTLVLTLAVHDGTTTNTSAIDYDLVTSNFVLSAFYSEDGARTFHSNGTNIVTLLRMYEVVSGGTGNISLNVPNTKVYGTVAGLFKIRGTYDTYHTGTVASNAQTTLPSAVSWGTPLVSNSVGVAFYADYDTSDPKMFFEGHTPSYDLNVGGMYNGRGTCISTTSGQSLLNLTGSRSSYFGSSVFVVVFDLVSTGSGSGGGGSGGGGGGGSGGGNGGSGGGGGGTLPVCNGDYWSGTGGGSGGSGGSYTVMKEYPDPRKVVYVPPGITSAAFRNLLRTNNEPGTHFVFRDGVIYGGPFEYGQEPADTPLSGTQENPIVFRSETPLGSRIHYGIRIDGSDTKVHQHVMIYGLNITQVSWVYYCRYLIVRRCRFESWYPGKSLYINHCPYVRVDYCDFHVETLPKYTARTGQTYTPPSPGTVNHGGLNIDKFSSSRFDNNTETREAVVHRCYFHGGMPTAGYYAPSQHLIMVADQSFVTIQPPYNTIPIALVRLCYFEPKYGKSPCLYWKVSNIVVDRIYVETSGSPETLYMNWPRHGFNNWTINSTIESPANTHCKHLDHKFINVKADRIAFVAGNMSSRVVPAVNQPYWHSTTSAIVVNCNFRLDVGVEYTPPDIVPAENNRIWNHTGQITKINEVGTQIYNTTHPDYPPPSSYFTLNKTEVGANATFRYDNEDYFYTEYGPVGGGWQTSIPTNITGFTGNWTPVGSGSGGGGGSGSGSGGSGTFPGCCPDDYPSTLYAATVNGTTIVEGISGGSGGGGGGSGSGSELPTPKRTIYVDNASQLWTALVNSRPGDHIVMRPGNYGQSPIILDSVYLSGTPTDPIVIRSENVMSAKYPGCFRFINTENKNVYLYGIEFTYDLVPSNTVSVPPPIQYLYGTNFVAGVTARGATYMPVNGTNIRFIRCRFHPPAPPSSGDPSWNFNSILVRPERCRDVWFAYCDLGMDTQAIVTARGLSAFGSNYGCIWNYQTNTIFSTGMWSQNTKFIRCYLYGGLHNVPYAYPNSQWIESGGDPALTNRPDYPYNWEIRYCYGELARNSTLLDFKGNSCRIYDTHIKQLITTNPGSIQIREGWYHEIHRCRFENCVIEIQTYGHKLSNTIGTVLVGSGTYDTFDTSNPGGWRAARNVELHRMRSHIRLGTAGWSYHPQDIRIYAHESTYSYAVNPSFVGVTFYPTSPIPREDPPILTRTEVGVRAPWAGWTGDNTSGGGGGGSTVINLPGELPTSLNSVVVNNNSELVNALNNANPGTHIVLNDGVYTGPFTVTRSGNSTNPIVIRSRNLMGAKIRGQGFVINDPNVNNVVFFGLDFEDISNMTINGRNLTFRRCRFTPAYNPAGARGLIIQDLKNSNFEYCTFHLYTVLEVQSRFGAGPNPWNNNTQYVCVWSYTNNTDITNNRHPQNIQFIRCRFEGGPQGVPVNAPYSSFVRADGYAGQFNSETYYGNWAFKLCYGNVSTDRNILNLRNGRGVLDRVHFVGPSSSEVVVGMGWRYVVRRSKFQGVRLVLFQHGHRIFDTEGTIIVSNGTRTWDTPVLSPADEQEKFAADLIQIHGCYGNLHIGYPGQPWSIPPSRIHVYVHSGNIIYNVTPTDFNLHSTAICTPQGAITLSEANTGHDAPWAGTD